MSVHAPPMTSKPAEQRGSHRPAVQATVPSKGGTQGVHDAPQVAALVLLAHVAPQAWKPVAHALPQVVPSQLALPFAGASSYPTCFSWDRATMLEKAAGKKREGIARLTDGITGLAPRVAVPFASSWALLEESELWKNFIDRPTPDEAT